MLKLLDYFQTTLTKYVSPGDTEMYIKRSDVQRLNELEEGDYVYLTLHSAPGKPEVVKYVHTTDNKRDYITVERGVNGVIRNFHAGTCVVSDLNSYNLTELMQQMAEDIKAQVLLELRV